MREFWLIDRANRSVEIFNLRKGRYVLASHAEERGTVASQVIDGFAVAIATIMLEEKPRAES